MKYLLFISLLLIACGDEARECDISIDCEVHQICFSSGKCVDDFEPRGLLVKGSALSLCESWDPPRDFVRSNDWCLSGKEGIYYCGYGEWRLTCL